MPQSKKGYLRGVRGVLITALNPDGSENSEATPYWIDTAQSVGIEATIIEGESDNLRGGDRVLTQIQEVDTIVGATLSFTDARHDCKATELIAGGTLIYDGTDPTLVIGWEAPKIADQANRIPIKAEVYVQNYNASGGKDGYLKYTFYYGIGYAPNVTHEDNSWGTPEFTIKCSENGALDKPVYDKKFVTSLPAEASA